MTAMCYQMNKSIWFSDLDIHTMQVAHRNTHTSGFLLFLCLQTLWTGWRIHMQSDCEAIHKKSPKCWLSHAHSLKRHLFFFLSGWHVAKSFAPESLIYDIHLVYFIVSQKSCCEKPRGSLFALIMILRREKATGVPPTALNKQRTLITCTHTHTHTLKKRLLSCGSIFHFKEKTIKLP